MASDEKKRNRAANFSYEEQVMLLNIVSRYKGIIESKATNAVTWRDKDQAWNKISADFNSQSPSQTFRSKSSLKKWFDNRKQKSKEIACVERQEAIKTGGGTLATVKDPLHDLTLSIINKTSDDGLENCFDGDRMTVLEVDVLQEYENDNAERGENYEIVHEESLDCRGQKRKASPKITSENESNETVDWGSYESSRLKKPLHNKIQNSKEHSSSEWEKRGSPVSFSSNSPDIAKELAEAKLQLIKLQIETLKEECALKRVKMEEEFKIRKQRDQEEYELRKKSLELDIQIKKLQLQKLQSAIDLN